MCVLFCMHVSLSRKIYVLLLLRILFNYLAFLLRSSAYTYVFDGRESDWIVSAHCTKPIIQLHRIIQGLCLICDYSTCVAPTTNFMLTLICIKLHIRYIQQSELIDGNCVIHEVHMDITQLHSGPMTFVWIHMYVTTQHKVVCFWFLLTNNPSSLLQRDREDFENVNANR